jgi:hypothetical protein
VCDKQKDPEVVSWKLSDLISDDRPNFEFFPCISSSFSEKLGFYPDFIFASATFVAALLRPGMNYSLPNVEAIIEVFAPGSSSTACERDSSQIVFIALQEADTLCCLLRKTCRDLRQRILLYIIDSNGYCSDVVTYCEPASHLLDGPKRVSPGLLLPALPGSYHRPAVSLVPRSCIRSVVQLQFAI